MGGSNIKIESSYQFQLKNYFTKTIDDKMITNDVSEHVQLQEASKEKLAVFGGELLKRKSSTCLLPTIIENNKNKQYVNVTSDTSRAIKKVPSRLYNSAPPDEKQEMTLQVTFTYIVSELLKHLQPSLWLTNEDFRGDYQLLVQIVENQSMCVGHHYDSVGTMK